MWTKFVLKNFKSIGETGVDLGLKPLTLLIGPPGGGKSSILEAICMFAQSVGSAGFNFSAPFAVLNSISFVAHKGESQRRIFVSAILGDIVYSYAYTPDTGAAAESIAKAIGTTEDNLLISTLEGSYREGLSYRITLPSGDEKSLAGESSLPFLSTRWLHLWPEKQTELNKAAQAAEKLAASIRNKVFPLSALRGQIPPEASQRQGPVSLWVNTGDALLQVLGVLQSPTHYKLRERIEGWSRKFGLSRVGAAPGALGPLQGHFVDPVLEVPLNLALASYGARQALSMIVQLFWAPPGSLIMIEEPEISLHPEAQVKLGELFAEAIQEDKQVIATTHSHFLLLALGRVVQKGLLKTSDIAIYHVTKDEGGTKVSKVKLSKRGYPLGWPPSFAKVEKELALEWSKALSEPPS